MITTNTEGNALSQAFIDAVGQGIIDYDVMLFSEGTDTGWGIQRMELQLGAGAEAWDDLADFHPGEVYSSQMEAKLYDVSGTVIGTELEVRVGVWTGSAYEYVTVAWMTIVKASEWKGITTVKARGRVASKLSVSAGLADGSMTPSALAAAISTACGVTVTVGTFTNLPDVDVDASMTCREALSALAKRLGGYGAETPDGGVLVASYGSSEAYALPEDFVTYAPDFVEGTYTVSGLTVESAAGVWTFGDGRVHLEDQKATQATATMTWGNLQGYSYQPGNIEVALIDPRVTVFDTVSTSVDGTARSLPARGITITYDGGYFGTYSASGIPLEEERSLIEGPLTERLSSAQQAAEEAAAIAEAVDQHFWYNTQGAHVTEQIQSDFLEAQADGFPDLSDTNPYYNTLWNANGMLLRSGDTNLAAFTRSSTTFFDGQGNAEGNVRAYFGGSGARLGYTASTSVGIDSESIVMTNAYNQTIFSADADGALITGDSTTVEYPETTSSFSMDSYLPPYQSERLLSRTIDTSDLLSGATITTGTVKIEFHTGGYDDVTVTDMGGFTSIDTEVEQPVSGGSLRYRHYLTGPSMTFVQGTGSSVEYRLTAETPTGENVFILFSASYGGSGVQFTETLRFTMRGGDTSESGGGTTTFPSLSYYGAMHAPSFILGTNTGDPGAFAAGVGRNVSPTGNYSFAQGEGTSAASPNQMAIGKYNAEDTTGSYAFIVGNGTADNARSNAFAIDWSGNLDTAGSYSIGGGLSVGGAATAESFNLWHGQRTLSSADNIDSLFESGIFYLPGSVPGGTYPSGVTGQYASILSMGNTGDGSSTGWVGRQLLVTGSGVWYRAYAGSPRAWTDWKPLDESSHPTEIVASSLTLTGCSLNGASTIPAYKIGRHVTINMRVNVTAANPTIAGFPATSGANSHIPVIAYRQSDNAAIAGYMTNAGVVTFPALASGSNIMLHVEYIASS